MKCTDGMRPGAVMAALLSAPLVACATGMKMTTEELQEVGPDEGLVLGFLRIEGGKDILGRKGWKLVAQEADPGWQLTSSGEYAIGASRGGEEVVFLTKMPAGDYRFYQLAASGFSNAAAEVDIPFRARPGTTTYMGRLVFRFPPGLITAGTRLSVSVENDRTVTVSRAESEYGIRLMGVVTDLVEVY